MPGFIDAAPAGGGYVPLNPAPSAAAQNALPWLAKDHPPFSLAYHPRRWGWFAAQDGGEWLPILKRIVHVPGVDNVDKDGGTATAFVLAQSRGWTVLPHEVVPGDSYVRSVPCRDGVAHVHAWTRIKRVGMEILVSSDEEGYRAWLRRMCEVTGIRPDPDILAMRIAQIERECGEDEAQAALDLKARGRAERARAALDVMTRPTENPAPEKPASKSRNG